METDRREGEYGVRYSVPEDLPPLIEWASAPESRKWLPVSTDSDVRDFCTNWIGFTRFGASLTATHENKPVGVATLFLMPYRKLFHHALFYFIVDPAMRGKGIGTLLVRNGTHLGKTYFRFEKMHVELYEGCPAISILKKTKYEEIVRQERFVKEEGGTYLARYLFEVCLQEEGEVRGEKIGHPDS